MSGKRKIHCKNNDPFLLDNLLKFLFIVSRPYNKAVEFIFLLSLESESKVKKGCKFAKKYVLKSIVHNQNLIVLLIIETCFNFKNCHFGCA